MSQLWQYMQNEGITSKLKELEQLKLSPSTKCAAADKFTPPQKIANSSAECWDHCKKIKTNR